MRIFPIAIAAIRPSIMAMIALTSTEPKTLSSAVKISCQETFLVKRNDLGPTMITHRVSVMKVVQDHRLFIDYSLSNAMLYPESPFLSYVNYSVVRMSRSQLYTYVTDRPADDRLQTD